MEEIDLCTKQLTNPNPQLYDDALWDIAKGNCTYFRTRQAARVCSFSSTISGLSSVLIIYIILISSTRLSSIYHRILFAMSICDIICSFPCALSTLPMPAPGDMWTDINNIEGPRIGNVYTCSAQGYLFDLGVESYFKYYSSLLIYYLFAIGFRVSNENMEKYLEPLLHGISISTSIFIATKALIHGDYNASYDFPVCSSYPKPWFCGNEDNGGIECVRGAKAKTQATTGNLAVAERFFLSSFLLLCILCIDVFMRERKHELLVNKLNEAIRRHHIKRRGQLLIPAPQDTNSTISTLTPPPPPPQENSSLLPTQQSPARNAEETQSKSSGEIRFQETKMILLQAFLYAISLALLVVSWMILSCHKYPSNMFFKSVLFTLSYSQGFLNLAMFIFHKVYNLKACNPEISAKTAIKDIFENGGVHDAVVITEIGVVTEYHSTQEQDNNVQDFDHNIIQSSRLRQQAENNETAHFPQFFHNENEMEIEGNWSYGISATPGSTTSRSSVSFLISTGSTYHTNEGSTTFPRGLEGGQGQGNNELDMIDEQTSLSGRSRNDDMSYDSERV